MKRLPYIRKICIALTAGIIFVTSASFSMAATREQVFAEKVLLIDEHGREIELEQTGALKTAAEEALH